MSGKNHPGQAIAYAQQALEMADAHQNPEARAKALFFLAEASLSQGYAERIGDAGFCYFALDRYQEANDLYVQSLGIVYKTQQR